MTCTETVPTATAETGAAGIGGSSAFVAELCLGASEVGAVDAERVVDIVCARAVAGGYPIPVAVAWNTVHFGWNPERTAYDDTVIYGEELPTVNTAEGSAMALPVGAVVWVRLGDAIHWAEIVGKDGRPPGLDEGIAPADMVGGSATVHGDAVTIREAWAFDFDILGPADAAVDGKLRRLARRGKLDKHCLYVVDAAYDSISSANDSDAEFFTRWMVDNQAALLLAGPLGEILSEDDDETLAAGLAASMAAIADICDNSERLVRWGDTWLPVEWVYDIDDHPGLPLHAADLEHIAKQLAWPGKNTTVGWVSLGQRLDDVLEQQQSDDPYARGRNKADRTIFDDYAGATWLKVLARSGRWIADVAADHRGIVSEATSRRLRVDDTWAHGSLWRSAPSGYDHPLLDEVREDIALSLGADPDAALCDYFGIDTLDDIPTDPTDAEPAVPEATDGEAEPSGQPEPEPTPETEPATAPDDEPSAPEPEPTNLDDSIVAAAVTLRAADIAHNTLVLPSAMTWLVAGTAVTVRVIHEEIDPSLVVQHVTVTSDGYYLTGIEWPDTCFEGIKVAVSALIGATVVSVMTRPLDEPVEFDGIEYRHQFDKSVIDPRRPERPVSMATLLISAISRHGRETYGTRRASAAAIANILFGDDAPPLLTAVVTQALGQLLNGGRLKLAGTEFLWQRNDLRSRRPRRFVADDLSTRDDLERVVRRHLVFGHLRQLTYWQSASQDAIDEYHHAHRQGNRYARSPDLPAGYTWVREHPRGNEIITIVNALAVADGGVHSRADIEHNVRLSLSVTEEPT